MPSTAYNQKTHFLLSGSGTITAYKYTKLFNTKFSVMDFNIS